MVDFLFQSPVGAKPLVSFKNIDHFVYLYFTRDYLSIKNPIFLLFNRLFKAKYQLKLLGIDSFIVYQLNICPPPPYLNMMAMPLL